MRSDSIIEYLMVLEPPATYLTYKTKKSDGDLEFLDIRGVPTKGTLMIKSVCKALENIQEDAKRCQEHHRTRESVTMTGSLRHSDDGRQDRLATTVVYMESQIFK